MGDSMRPGPSKMKDVLAYMQDAGSITSMEAFPMGVTRLSAIIFELRHKYGYSIETVEVDGKDRYGHAVQYARYVLS